MTLLTKNVRKLTLLTGALTLFAATSYAQTPAAAWRTITTEHFRIHYPREYEAWTRRVVSKIESIRDTVARETGYATKQRTDVIVMNPFADPNGLTLPLLDTPRIVLFAEPPGPETQIGDYNDWVDLLVTHEMTHVEHLTRPSRNPELRLIEQILLPVGPIALSAPRWVSEGYATMIEGYLTGSGRPHSAYRAAVLRKWAQTGRLPRYADLEANHSFLGMSMAYLAGSAYLEWLEERSGAGSLQKLWRRMTARQRRSFDDAFEGVFGDSPQRLYGRFTAELTERAVNVDRETAADLREGTLWQETKENSGDPAVSPDGKSIAIVIRDREHHAKLVTYSTAEPIEEEKKEHERIDTMLKRDPEDVAPVRMQPLERKPQHTLRMPLDGDISTPRWMPDGASILFSHHSRDRNGDRHHDLYRWTIATSAVDRITHEADVFDADPFPDGRRAVAIQSRFGAAHLVFVDLSTGAVTRIDRSVDVAIFSHPRVSADGTRMAFVANVSSQWYLGIRDVDTQVERQFHVDGNIATPEWRGHYIYATVMHDGFIDIREFDSRLAGMSSPNIDKMPPFFVTRTSGGAFAPAPSPDGRLFFMSLEPDGFALRVINSVAPAPPRIAASRSLVPALPPPATKAWPFTFGRIPPSRAYGVGHQELGWIISGNSAPSAHNTEIGIRSGDVIGRVDAVAIASFGNRSSPRGGTVAVAYHGLPIEIDAQAFRARDPLLDQRGFDLHGAWRAAFETSDIAIESGALARHPSSFAFVSARARLKQMDSSESFELSGESHHARAWARGETKFVGLRFGVEAQRDRGNVTVGGIAPSILPRSAIANRIIDPALQIATMRGTNYTGLRADVSLAGLTLFYRQHRMNERLNVGGVEIARRMEAMPLVKTPALDFTVGAARVLHRTRWWIGVRIAP